MVLIHLLRLRKVCEWSTTGTETGKVREADVGGERAKGRGRHFERDVA